MANEEKSCNLNENISWSYYGRDEIKQIWEKIPTNQWIFMWKKQKPCKYIFLVGLVMTTVAYLPVSLQIKSNKLYGSKKFV